MSGAQTKTTCVLVRLPQQPTRSSELMEALNRYQNPAVSLRNSGPPAVSAKSKSTDRRVLRRSQLPSQRTPRNTTPTLATTSADTKDLRLSAAAASATSPSARPPTSRSHFPRNSRPSRTLTSPRVIIHLDRLGCPRTHSCDRSAVSAKTKCHCGVMVV